MMDPLTVIGLVGNIVQFVDFTSKLLSKAGEVYRSADGALVENTDLEIVANDLISIFSPRNPNTTIPSDNPALDALWSKCEEVGKELLEALAKLKIQGQKTKWKSFRKALKSVWSKEEIEALLKRLSSFRDELNLRILVDLREHVNFSEIRQSESFQKLDEKSQRIVNLIVQQQNVFTNSIQKQTEEIKALHAESKATVIEQHTTTRVEIIQAIQVTKESSEADRVATRQEIANLKAAIKELSEQMKQKDAELSQFLKEFREARTEKKRNALQERSNAVSATLLALEMIYRSLQALLISIQTRTLKALEPLKEGYNWRVFTYPSQQNPGTRPARRKVRKDKTIKAELDSGGIVAVLVYDDNAHYGTAVDMYYSYFYSNLHLKNQLVDVVHMHQKWPPLTTEFETVDVIQRVANKNCQGFIVQRNTPGLPTIWTMALLISALEAWEEGSSLDIMRKVFQETEGIRLAPGSFTDGGSRGKEFRSDMNFWKVHAKDRGIDEAMINRFRESRVISSFSRNKTNRHLLVDFIIWLIGPSFSQLRNYEKKHAWVERDCTNVRNRQAIFVKHFILQFATVLNDSGLAVDVHKEEGPYPDGEEYEHVPIVVLQSSKKAETLSELVSWDETDDHWHFDGDLVSAGSKPQFLHEFSTTELSLEANNVAHTPPSVIKVSEA